MKILIIEDNEKVARLIDEGLSKAGYDTTVAYDGARGEQLALKGGFDLIITDIILPKKDGLEVCKNIKAAQPFTPVIMLTALGTTDEKIEGFDAGADDYMAKPFEFRELKARVKAHLKKNKHSNQNEPASELRYADIIMNLNTREVFRQEKPIELTPKEFNLLKFMLENPERVLPRDLIAQKVWDTHFDTGTNFIDVYINYLRKKIDKQFGEKLIHTKTGIGFILKK